jgi:hypothetical protein
MTVSDDVDFFAEELRNPACGMQSIHLAECALLTLRGHQIVAGSELTPDVDSPRAINTLLETQEQLAEICRRLVLLTVAGDEGIASLAMARALVNPSQSLHSILTDIAREF